MTLINNSYEYGVPYVSYQIVHKDNEFWEVDTPRNLQLNEIKIHHWKVLGEVRFGWHNYIEVKVYEVDKGYEYWLRVELISMGHLLKTHYFETRNDAIEYSKWYLNKIKEEATK